MNHKNIQNLYYLKDLEHLKQQMIKLQHTVMNNLIMHCCKKQYSKPIVKFITGLNTPKTTGLLLQS